MLALRALGQNYDRARLGDENECFVILNPFLLTVPSPKLINFKRACFNNLLSAYQFIRYYTALANTGLLTLTTPYLDFGGAGVVITMARTLHRGEVIHKHNTNDEILGVMGADFPLTYFYRLENIL